MSTSGAPATAPESCSQRAAFSYWGLVWQQFRKRRDAYVGFYLLLALFSVALTAPFLSNDLPLWVSAPDAAYSPLLRDFLFPMEHLDRFYNLLLVVLLVRFVLKLVLKRWFAALDDSVRKRRSLVFTASCATTFLALFGISWLTGVHNERTDYRHIKESGAAQVYYTLLPWGARQDDPARTDLKPGHFHRIALLFSGGSLDGVSLDYTSSQLPLNFGSKPGNKVLFDAETDPTVEPQHCEITRVGQSIFLSNLAQSGTWLNGRPILGAQELQHGALIRLGENGPACDLTLHEEKHYLGCDNSGFDVLTRLIYGSRVSLAVGFLAVGMALLIGVYLGSLAGYFGGWVDILASRVIEIFICFPTFFLILTIIAVVPGRSIFWVMLAIGITGWMGVARLIRGEVLKVRQYDYIQAARALGVSDVRIIFRHILPNAMAPVLVSATFGVAGAILSEAMLGFLGLGVAPPHPSWGELLNQARQDPVRLWWLMLYPSLMIFAGVTLLNLVGEGLRDAMDPRLRK